MRYGLGSTVDYAYLRDFFKSLYITIIIYMVTQFSVKFSILFQCKRIFTGCRANQLFLGLIIYLAIFCAVCLLLSIISCWPIAKYWDDTIPGRCSDEKITPYVLAGINIVNDIVLLVAPMPFLRSLQVARRAKIALISVFACGAL